MIKEMCKVQLIGLKGLLDDVIKEIHDLGVLHIESTSARILPEEPYLHRIPLEGEKSLLKSRLEKMLESLKGIYLLLPVTRVEGEEPVLFEDIIYDAFLDKVVTLEKEVRELHAERAELLEEMSSIERYEMILKGIAPLVVKLKGLKDFETIGITIDKSKEDIIPLLENELIRITEERYHLSARDIDENIVGVVISYPVKYEGQVKRLISAEEISEIKLPQKYAEMTMLEALRVMIKRRDDIPFHLIDIENRLKGLSEKWYRRLEKTSGLLRDTIDELDALKYCAHTRFTFVITGWVPKDTFHLLFDAMMKVFGNRVIVQEIEIREDEIDLIPVCLKNPRILKPFEVFLNILPPAKYGSVDPTPYLAVFFPTFFGLILGDAGYGGILLFLSLYLKRRFKGKKEFIVNLASIFTISSLFAIIFGVLFGEFFGDLGEKLNLLHPIIFDRLKAMQVFLVLAIGIGLGHITLGLMLAVVNYIQRGKGKQALAKASMLILILTLIATLAIKAGYIPVTLMSPFVLTILVAFSILIVFEGIIGPLDVLKTIGNILSYARIMAIGTASVVLALIANKIGGMAGNVILGIIMAAMIHIVNILLGILGSTIHSLRLHYVEFFSKFYEPGGRRYTPFKKAMGK